MSRLNGCACLEVFVVLTFCFTLSAPAMSQTSLETVCGIYQQHTPENFDDGGEISHYVWKNFVSFFPQVTITRIRPERSLPGSPDSALTSAMVETESGLSHFGSYVEGNPFIDGVIVLAEGRIIFESYPNMKAYDRHLGWSITKVVVSTALAALESQVGSMWIGHCQTIYLSLSALTGRKSACEISSIWPLVWIAWTATDTRIPKPVSIGTRNLWD